MRIWAQGAAQGAWKERTRSVDGGVELRADLNWASDLISVSSAISEGVLRECELSYAESSRDDDVQSSK